MSDSSIFSRRKFLSLAAAAAAAPAGLVGTAALAADLPALAVTDPAAKNLGYVVDASKIDAKAEPLFKVGSACSNCTLYGGAAGSASGSCGLFAGKAVAAKGWCKAYAKKAA